MSSKHVIGFTSHHGRETAIVYLQIKTVGNPYDVLAEALANYDDHWLAPDTLRADLIYYISDLFNGSEVTLTVHEPVTDHTIHIVDTLKQEVQLFDKNDKHLLVSYGYDKFRDRYGY